MNNRCYPNRIASRAAVFSCAALAIAAMSVPISTARADNDRDHDKTHYTLPSPMTLRDEGTFFIGGQKAQSDFPSPVNTGLNAPGTYVINQMFVHYRIPAGNSKKLPIIMVHGSNHTGNTYETTPDGREGWATYFVRHGYPVYVVDQAGRGRSSFNPTVVNQAIAQQNLAVLPAAGFQLYPRDGAWINFLFGPAPNQPWPDERFPLQAIDQYQSQLVPNTEVTLNGGTANTTNDLALLLDKIGPAILIVHSQSGTLGLGAVVQRPNLVKGLISVEGGCTPITDTDTKQAYSKVPFLSFWGDHSVGAVGANGDSRRQGCQATVAAFKQAGGNAQFLLLPDLGIKGNSHMMMMDNNNLELADILETWIIRNVERDKQSRCNCGPHHVGACW